MEREREAKGKMDICEIGFIWFGKSGGMEERGERKMKCETNFRERRERRRNGKKKEENFRPFPFVLFNILACVRS